MSIAGVVLTVSCVGTLIAAFIAGGPPAEILIGIPGVFYMIYRWKKP